MDRNVNRDLDDLNDPNLRVYQFRGYNIFKLNKEHKRLYIGFEARNCLPCTEDCKLMAEFLLQCHEYLEGKREDVDTVTVN